MRIFLVSESIAVTDMSPKSGLLFAPGSARPLASAVNSRMSVPSGSLTRTMAPFRWTRFDSDTKNILIGQLPDRQATKLVIVNMRAFGRTLGGIELESSEFQFTIRTCNGCLVSFAGGDDPAQEPRPNCKASLGTGASTTIPCFVGQDEPVPCQLCQGRPICDPALP